MSQAATAQKAVRTDLNDRLSALAALRYYGTISAYEHDVALAAAIESVYPPATK